MGGDLKADGNRWVRWSIRVAISAGLVVLLLLLANIERLAATVGRLELDWLLVAVLVKGTGILAGVLRWRLLLAGLEIRLPFSNLGGAYLVGRFFGSFLPSTIGLDAYRTYYAAVRTRRVAHCITVTVVEKVAGLLALSLLTLAVLPLGLRLLPVRALWIIGAIICAPIVGAGLLLFYPGLFVQLAQVLKRRGKRFGKSLAKMSEAVAIFSAQRARLLLALLLGFVVHGATSSMYVATARAVGVDIPAGEILFVGPLMIAATLVPVSIAGIGVRETTYVFFLTRIGVLPEPAGLLAFLGFLAGELYSLAGGGVWALTPAARPEEGHGLVDVARRAAAWVRGGRTSTEEEPAQ